MAALQFDALLLCLLGVTLGTLVGVLPGIGAITAVALLLPLTFDLPPAGAIMLLAGIYYGSEYGGSISSILLNIPGTPASIVTGFDGYPMARQGHAGMALLLTALASLFGGVVGIMVMLVAAPAIGTLAMSFGAAEFTALIVLGLIIAVFINDHRIPQGMAMLCLGMLLGMVGMDVNTGVQRFTLDWDYLQDGISLVIFAMGLFGVSELFQAYTQQGQDALPVKTGSLFRGLRETNALRRFLPSSVRGAGVGAFFGALPGTGPTIASFIAYAVEKRLLPRRYVMGTGTIEGVCSPEAANNAAAQTAFIPTLTLGLPGSATMAVMLGALMMHGITPGPAIVTQHAEVYWALIGSFLVGNVLLLVLNVPLIRLWILILKVPRYVLNPAMLTLICVGAYTLHRNPFDVLMLFVFGCLGFFLRTRGYPLASVLIGFIMGPLLEEHLRRVLLISQGDLGYFLQRPVSLVLFFMGAVVVALSLWSSRQARREAG
ncbi:tripartite tricarboxylate transporter permease [Halomonas lysinitropha]